MIMLKTSTSPIQSGVSSSADPCTVPASTMMTTNAAANPANHSHAAGVFFRKAIRSGGTQPSSPSDPSGTSVHSTRRITILTGTA